MMALIIAMASLSLFVAAAPSPLPLPEGIRIPLILSNIFTKRDDDVNAMTLFAQRMGLGQSINNTSEAGFYDRPDLSKRAKAGLTKLSPSASAYSGEITVGTPPQRMTAVFDTGSTDSWFLCTECISGPCEGHSLYNPSQSTTKNVFREAYSIKYVAGDMVGRLYTDTVVVSKVNIPGMAFLAAYKIAEHFRRSNYQADGVVGMSFMDSASAPPESAIHNSFLNSLMAQNPLFQPVFSFKLSEKPGDAELIVGVSGHVSYDHFTFVDVVTPNQWAIPLDAISVGGKSIALESGSALIDTGSSLILGPAEEVKKIYDAIIGAEPNVEQGSNIVKYIFPCGPGDPPVVITMTFGRKVFPFNLSLMALGNTGFCYGGLAGVPLSELSITGPSRWVVGHIFLRAVVALFEFQREGGGVPRIGFVTQAVR